MLIKIVEIGIGHVVIKPRVCLSNLVKKIKWKII